MDTVGVVSPKDVCKQLQLSGQLTQLWGVWERNTDLRTGQEEVVGVVATPQFGGEPSRSSNVFLVVGLKRGEGCTKEEGGWLKDPSEMALANDSCQGAPRVTPMRARGKGRLLCQRLSRPRHTGGAPTPPQAVVKASPKRRGGPVVGGRGSPHA